MNKLRLFIAAAVVAIVALFAPVSSASAIGNSTVGNTVHNHWDSLGNVKVWYGGNGQYATVLSPGSYVGTAQCFYPTQDAHSQWGGLYRAYEVRCFATNYNYLFLHVGR